jgi:hypothetical protein
MAIWLYLLFARGGFWRIHPADESPWAKVSDLSEDARVVVPIWEKNKNE